jgi:hypothetical protein
LRYRLVHGSLVAWGGGSADQSVTACQLLQSPPARRRTRRSGTPA